MRMIMSKRKCGNVCSSACEIPSNFVLKIMCKRKYEICFAAHEKFEYDVRCKRPPHISFIIIQYMPDD